MQWDSARSTKFHEQPDCRILSTSVTFALPRNHMDDDNGNVVQDRFHAWRCLYFALVQSQAPENELGFLLGATVTRGLQTLGPTPTRLNIGSGITFQMRYARQLSSNRIESFYFEVPAIAVPLQDIKASVGAVPRKGSSRSPHNSGPVTFYRPGHPTRRPE